MFCATTPRGGGQKDTLRNILATRQFVVNVVSNALAAQMNATSAELPPDASEFSHVSPPLTPLPSKLVRPPRVAESPIALECELFQVVPVGEGPMSGNVVIGRIVSMHVDDAVLTGGAIDPAKLDTIGRMGGNFYSRTRDRFALERPS
jgi:flavin reductase (DIM6/NTAB) family NADH-FMN oxidoreductase RutF